MGGAGLKLTTARYYTPNGNSLESKGLIPDIPVDEFAAEEIVVGGGGGSGGTTGSDATIRSDDSNEDDDDPQLATAVKLARASLRTGGK